MEGPIFYEATEIKKLCKELEQKRKTRVLTLLFGDDNSITTKKVDRVYDKLRSEYKDAKKLDIIIDCVGGNIDAAYMIAKIIRRYAPEKLSFIVPRWAKSAATLLSCSGDELFMGPTSELGPLDPQIRIFDAQGNIKKSFSPLSFRSTFDLLKSEYLNGNQEVAKTIADKMDPIELGDAIHSLDVSERYMTEILVGRMFKSDKNAKTTAERIANQVNLEYPHHGYCIDIDECKRLGLKVSELPEEQWDLVWKIYCKYEELEVKRAEQLRESKLKK